MSICRWSAESNVYVFEHVGGWIECCGCALGGNYTTEDPNIMILHLQQHRAHGHLVPDYAIEELTELIGHPDYDK